MRKESLIFSYPDNLQFSRLEIEARLVWFKVDACLQQEFLLKQVGVYLNETKRYRHKKKRGNKN
jgi:hypothetical protein